MNMIRKTKSEIKEEIYDLENRISSYQMMKRRYRQESKENAARLCEAEIIEMMEDLHDLKNLLDEAP